MSTATYKTKVISYHTKVKYRCGFIWWLQKNSFLLKHPFGGRAAFAVDVNPCVCFSFICSDRYWYWSWEAQSCTQQRWGVRRGGSDWICVRRLHGAGSWPASRCCVPQSPLGGAWLCNCRNLWYPNDDLPRRISFQSYALSWLRFSVVYKQSSLLLLLPPLTWTLRAWLADWGWYEQQLRSQTCSICLVLLSKHQLYEFDHLKLNVYFLKIHRIIE